MKAFTKFLTASVVAGGAMLAMSAPASAQVSFGIGIGPGGFGGGYYGGFGGGGYYNGMRGGYYGGVPAYSCDTWSGLYNPYRCGYPAYPAYPYYSRSYYGPAYGGAFGYYAGPRYVYPRGYGYRGGYRGRR